MAILIFLLSYKMKNILNTYVYKICKIDMHSIIVFVKKKKNMKNGKILKY